MKDLLFIEAEDVVKLNINGWDSDLCNMSGAVSWTHDEKPITFYATPNWEDLMGSTPIAWTDDDGDYHELTTIVYIQFRGDLKSQLEYYQAELEKYMKLVLQTI
jgi:hypothetical protein